MGSPYLNSGEAIVLTTNRVSADTIEYDVMLTTERIFLIDNRNARFEPLIIPLSTILSVHGGKTPSHDPVITLLFRTGDEGDARQPLNLVFSQNPPENRKPERDDWVRNLIQLSITQHNKEIPAEAPSVPEVSGEIGLRPAVRHWIAPEKVRPLSNVVQRKTTPVPVTVIPDEVEGEGEIPAPEAGVAPVEESSGTEPVSEEPSPDFTPVRGTPPAPLARVIIPQIIEELLPGRTVPVPPPEQVPAPVTDIDNEALHSIQTEILSLMDTEEQTPEPPPVPETAEVPADWTISQEIIPVPPRVPETATIPEVLAEGTSHQEMIPEPPPVPETPEVPADGIISQEMIPVPPRVMETATIPEVLPEGSILQEMIPEPPPVPETATIPEVPADGIIPGEPAVIRALHTGAPLLPVPESETGAAPEPVHESPGAGIDENPESNIILPVPENEVEGSGYPAPEILSRQEPASDEAPPIQPPVPPARDIRPPRTMLAYAGLAILIIVLAAAGVMLLLAQEPQGTGIPVTPTPATVQVITIAPDMVQTTTLPPAATVITTPVPSLPASPVPQTGVWVRVNSTAFYAGQTGNAELMQPVSGTGDNFYKVPRNDRPVQVSIQKQDNSGARLTVGIYRNGTLISTRSVTSPMGTVDLLINPITGKPPGLTANDTLPENTDSTVWQLQNY